MIPPQNSSPLKPLMGEFGRALVLGGFTSCGYLLIRDNWRRSRYDKRIRAEWGKTLRLVDERAGDHETCSPECDGTRCDVLD
jgi:hypothetical protein